MQRFNAFSLCFFIREVFTLDILAQLGSHAAWQDFYEYKVRGGHLNREDEKDLLLFLEEKGYAGPVQAIARGEAFAPPRKASISKMHSEKKRTVYIFPRAENYVLKFLTHLLQRKYDHLFAPNLFSFRPGTGVRDAIHAIVDHPGIGSLWGYKADIHNYFNAIPVQLLLPALDRTLSDEPAILVFLKALLLDDRSVEQERIVHEPKGIMAGVPVSTFLANLYLAELDHRFFREGILYARYSDDIILFAPTREARDRHAAGLRQHLSELGLSMNPKKELYFGPGESWVFLGVSYEKGIIDVAPASVDKLKAKMRRKSRALMRWKARKNTTGENAAKAFIRTFNRKFFANNAVHELTWVRWYFPLINTSRSLQEIDRYSQDCIRYLVTGKRTKARYNCRYGDLKSLGYVSLVNAYYAHRRFSEISQETVD